MSKYENKAAYLEGAKVRPLAVRDAPYTAPGPGQITIKNEAIALNPLESIKQTIGNFLYEWVKYPFIMGADVSGTVVEVGSKVTRFKVGDRVVAFATGMEKKHNKSAMCGFQLFTVVQQNMASPIPSSIQCEKAVVMPLGLTTAACGLFQKDQLGLHHPTPGTKHQTEKEVVIVWGGSTSVGCNAIQLATAAGYEVITTCSERNFDMVKSLGATAAYDYRSPTVTEDMKRACQGKKIAGAMTIGAGGAEKCTEVLGSCKGNRFISMISFPTPSDPDAGALQRIGTFLLFSVKIGFKKTTLGVRSKFVWSSTIEDNEVSKAIFEDFLPHALENGEYICAPDPEIIGHDLGAIQSGLDRLKSGSISAKKLVVRL
ncbi:putative Zinc-binding oxidoreductase CipB [Seiridium unicorne]|uniref:Zinc-binding oxidoreductase CipB n=1 Tax=Seiridium unicorne TaxID=138068 RepID=A0ABR2VBW8_9PEZI